MPATGDTTSVIRDLLGRLHEGDPQASRAIMDRAYARIVRMTATLMARDFPRLSASHDPESVVSRVWLRLMKPIETSPPASPEDFFGLLFLKVRHVLIEMAADEDRRAESRRRLAEGVQGGEVSLMEGRRTPSPDRLAMLAELHEKAADLPDQERTVFGLIYLGFSQAEASETLGLPPRTVSRLWASAAGRLVRWLDGFGESI